MEVSVLGGADSLIHAPRFCVFFPTRNQTSSHAKSVCRFYGSERNKFKTSYKRADPFIFYFWPKFPINKSENLLLKKCHRFFFFHFYFPHFITTAVLHFAGNLHVTNAALVILRNWEMVQKEMTQKLQQLNIISEGSAFTASNLHLFSRLRFSVFLQKSK